MEEKVIVVDENDNEIGIGEKIKTHKEGKLHRAFSIFVFNSESKLLIQKRAKTKYHSGGLWANTCCSHPRPKEPIEKAVHRKLKQEMGFDCKLKEITTFIYKVKFDNSLFEHEYDHIFVGKSDETPKPNSEEAENYKWIDIEELEKDMQENPAKYTYWLKAAINKTALEDLEQSATRW